MNTENITSQVQPDYEIEYYKFVYTNKVSSVQNNMCLHRHHIVPKCLGGTENSDNIALLTPKDHVNAHVLMFKMLIQKSIKAAHAVVSMIGKDEILDDSVKLFDAMNEYDFKMQHAINALRKRKIVNVLTFERKNIGMFDQIPDGFVELIRCKDEKKARIYNINRIETKAMMTWPVKHELPCKDWRWYSDADLDIKLKLNPNAPMPRYSNAKTARAQKIDKLPMRYVHDLSTNKNILILKDADLPEGCAEGMYFSEEALKRIRAGGMKSAQINKDKYEGKKWRWVFDLLTLKNRLVERDAPLPKNCLEGMKDVRVDMQSVNLDMQDDAGEV